MAPAASTRARALLQAEPEPRDRVRPQAPLGGSARPWPLDWSAAAVLAVAAAALWLPYALSTTFAYDDWAYAAKSVLHLNQVESHRPGFALITAATGALFGGHARLYYVVADLCVAAMIAAALVALRRLGAPLVAAVVAAAALMLAPWADSLHLWWTASPIAVAVGLALLGVAAGARSAGAQGRVAAAWLALSLALVAAAVVTYEATAVLVLLGPAMLPRSSSPRRSLGVAAAQLVVVLPAAWLMYWTTSPVNVSTATPRGDWPSRFGGLALDSWRLFVGDVPGKLGWIGIAGATAAAAAAAVAVAPARARSRRMRQGVPAPRGSTLVADSGRNLLCAGLLMGGALLSVLPFTPANAYYTASAPGVGNRVNAATAVFVAAALGMLVAALLEPLRQRRGGSLTVVLGTACAAALVVGPGAAWTRQSLADAAQFTAAADDRQRVLAAIHTALPHAPPGSTVLLGDYARYRGSLAVPIFAETWDVQGAVRLTYADAGLSGAPLTAEDRCTAAGVALGESGPAVPWSALRVIDVRATAVVPIADAAGCQALLRGLVATVIDPAL